jgi:hypothetical protein
MRAAAVIHALLCCILAATLGSSSPPAEESCGAGGIPRIVSKDAHGAVQAVTLRRFDEATGAWEVDLADGDVGTVPAASLILDPGSHSASNCADSSSDGPTIRLGLSEMLNASGHQANTVLGVYATRRIEAGSVIIEEQPVVRGARSIAFGQGGLQSKALVERFLALPDVAPCALRSACAQGRGTW